MASAQHSETSQRLASGRGGRVASLAGLAVTLWLLQGGLLPGSAAVAQPISDAERERIDALFAEWDRWDSPGAAVAVVRGGELVYSRGYGSAQLEYAIPITPRTPFHVASVSKQFTDFAVALLARRGALSLDDPIQKYVAEVPDFGQTITLRQLANHTSGMRDQWELLAMAGWRLDDVITVEHILKMVERQRELNFAPNTEYTYCNTGYTLLAEVVARVSGKSFPEFTEEHIFKPLGMSHTHFHDDHEHLVPGRAYSYRKDERDTWAKSVLSYANAGATSLFTTAEDLARWLMELDEGRVFGKELLEVMHQRGVLENGEEIDYALGLAFNEYRGRQWVGHGGADAGFRSTAMRFPESGLGIVVLSNLAQFDAGGKGLEIADVLLEDVLLPRDSEAAAQQQVDVDPEVLERYVGRYVTDLGVVTVTRRGSRLIVEAPGQDTTALVAVSNREFLIESLSATLEFDSEETPGSFEVNVQGQVLRGERVDPVPVAKLGELTGDYYSPELDTHYLIVLEDGELLARHQRHSDIALTALSQDELVGDQWYFSRLRFERDDSGRIVGMRVSGGRVRNLWFERR